LTWSEYNDLGVLCRIWNHEEATLLNSFDNHDFPDKGISKLCLVNELDDSLLLAASCTFLDCLILLYISFSSCQRFNIILSAISWCSWWKHTDLERLYSEG